MSVARVLLSGVLVAGGLVLGTFAVHGYLDPNWTQSQLAAAAMQDKRSAETRPAAVFPSRSRFVAADPPQPKAVKAAAKPTVKPSEATATAKRRAAAKRKPVGRGKEPPPARQASLEFQWPWKLFGQ